MAEKCTIIGLVAEIYEKQESRLDLLVGMVVAIERYTKTDRTHCKTTHVSFED